MNNEIEAISQEELRKSLDAEVQRVSHLFRLILKYKEHFKPSGVEFSGLRQYLASDDASRIDWKISSGKPELYVKQYDEENEMEVFILLDVSNTMLFGTAEKLKTEYAAVIAATIAYASVDAGINVGLGIWGDDEAFITPNGGYTQYQKILHEVTETENYGGKFDLEDALIDVVGQIKENTTVFIISDFLNVEGDWSTKLKLANKKFRHVMCIMTRDLRDYQMPASGNFRFKSPETDDEIVVNTSGIKEAFDHEVAKQEERLESDIEGAGSSFLKIDTRDNFAAAFAEYFDKNEVEW